MANNRISLVAYLNEAIGFIENFVINMQEPLYGANDLYAVCQYNRGTIQNGYVYGKNIEATFPLTAGSVRYSAIITRLNYVKGITRNLYTTASVNSLKQEDVKDYIANIASNISSGCSIENSYSVGTGNITTGPNSVTNNDQNNCYYFSEKIFNSVSKKTAEIALWDTNFQNKVLNCDGQFEIDEVVSKGYYPHIKMPECMPRQEYIPLPEVKNADLADLTSIDIQEQTEDTATILCNIHNPSGQNIVDIKVENLNAEIISQEYSDGMSKVIVKLTNPIKCVSKYSVQSISIKGYFGTNYTRYYEKNERFMDVEFYKKVYTVQDWKKIKTSPTENYRLMNDLDFINEGTEIYINTTYSGTIDGNGHYMKNINITSNLIAYLVGTLKNVNFENIKIKKGATPLSLISTGSNCIVQNVHIRNIDLENISNQDYYVGTLFGSLYNSTMQDCSVKNVNIKIDNANSAYIGGISGYNSNSKIYNSYITNLNIVINNVSKSNGVGGIAGYMGGGDVLNCYAEGNIKAVVTNIGGIAGQNSSGNINNCYSKVNIYSEQDFIGGIEAKNSKVNNNKADSENLSIGNLYCKINAENFARIIGTGVHDGVNYAYKGQLINGLKTDEAYDAILLTKEQLTNKNTYIETLKWEEYDLTDVEKGILPKLYYKGTKQLLPNQDDIYLEEQQDLKIEKIDIQKEPESIKGLLVMLNENEVPITKIKIEDMDSQITKQINTEGKTYLEFQGTPTRFYDSYMLYEVEYEKNGEIKKQNLEVKIEAIFYKELYSFEDWQTIEIGTFQNYKLMNDIDFEGKTDIKTNVGIGKLEAEGERKKLKNISITINSSHSGLIKNVNNSMKNITFENVTVGAPQSCSEIGIIGIATANMENIEFSKIKITAQNSNYVGVIGNISYSEIKDVIINAEENLIENNKTEVVANNYVGTLAGSVVESTITGIKVQNATVQGNKYVGGLFGEISFPTHSTKYVSKITAQNVEVTGTENVGGIAGKGPCYDSILKNSKIYGKTNVGGITGICDSIWSKEYLGLNNIIIESTEIYGTGECIGGIIGNAH